MVKIDMINVFTCDVSPWRLSPERVDREEMEERIETESAAVLSDSKPLNSLKAMLSSV